MFKFREIWLTGNRWNRALLAWRKMSPGSPAVATARIASKIYNSAQSEPIWMKSGALWVHCWGLALEKFGRDPRSSDSWRARRNFLSGKQRTISPISRRPNFTKFAHKTSIGVAMKTIGTEFWKFYRKGLLCSKNAKISQKKFSMYQLRLQASITPHWL